MSLDLFNNKYVCVVLSCKRPYYENRRKANIDTFNILKSCGFVVVYAYSDNALTSIEIEPIEEGKEYVMTVPAPEIYELLSHKMNIVYNYFSKTSCKGILKIDDNTKILFSDIIEHDFMDLITQYDYVGLEQVIISKDSDPYYKLKNRTQMPIFTNIYHKIDIDVKYFAGPFYYVSKKAINTISEEGLQMAYEDMAVGHAVSKNKHIKRFMWNFKNIAVSWDNATEQDQKNKSNK